MAHKILTSFTSELIIAICNHVGEISDHCLERELISGEEYGQILDSKSTATDSALARTLLIAVNKAVAVNQSLFESMMKILINIVTPVPPFMQEMEKQYQDLECVHSRSRKRKQTDSETIADNKPKITKFILTRNIIIETFKIDLVSAMSISIGSLSDLFLERGLISNKIYGKVCETAVKSKEDKAEVLLEKIIENIENDDRCFDIFLTTLNETLPTTIGSKLVADIITESEKYSLVRLSSANLNDSSPCYQASEVRAKLDEVNCEKEELEKQLESEIIESKKLEEEISKLRAEGHVKAKQIENLNKMVAEREHEISRLREMLKRIEEEVDDLEMKIKRERELFQKQSGLTLKKSEVAKELCERLKVSQDLEKEWEEQRQAKAEFREDYIKLNREKNDLQQKKNALSRENGSLQSYLDFMEDMHSDCIRRSNGNPCYCDIMGREYCPRRHSLLE